MSINIDGTVTSDFIAIDLSSGSSVDNLSNRGVITGDSGYGIYINNSSSINTLNNSGAITGNTGIVVISSSITGDLTNSGTIEGTGGTAIDLLGLTQDLTMNLDGGRVVGDITDDAPSNGFSHIVIGGDVAMEGDYSVSSVSVTDGGNLSVDSGHTVNSDIEFNGLTADASVILNGGMVDGDITDDTPSNGFSTVVIGTDYTTSASTIITASNLKVDSGQTLDISSEAHLKISKKIENAGTITSGSKGLYLVSNNNLETLDNSGTITGGTGIYLKDGTRIGTLNNSGNITSSSVDGIYLNDSSITNLTNGAGATISAAYYGIYLGNNSSIDTLTNNGTISGVTGIIKAGDSNIGELINSGVIEGTDGTAISLYDLSQDLTMTLNGGSIIGKITDNAPSNGFSHIVIGDDFTTEGDITVSDLLVNSGKIFTISSGDTVKLGTISFGLEGDTIGQLVVKGAGKGIDLDGTTVTVTVGTATITDGAELQVGSGNATVIGMDGGSGQVATGITDNSILWDFEIVDGSQAEATSSTDDTKLYVVATAAEVEPEPDTPEEPEEPDTPEEPNILVPHAETPNNKNVAVVLDDLIETTNPELKMIWTALNNAGTDEEINDILEATQSDMSRGTVTAASYVANTAFNITSSRLGSIRSDGLAGSGISSGDITSGLQVWMQGFGEVGNQSNRGGIAGFDLTSYGFTAGMDSEELVDDAVIGLSMGYSATNVDSDSANKATTDITSWQVSAYGDYDLDEKSYINGMISYGYHQNEGSRVPVAGLVARSDYDAHQVMARVEVGRAIPVGSAVTLTPKGLAQASWYSPDKYTETGAGGANLTINQEDTAIAELGVGLDMGWNHQFENGGQLETIVGVQYRYDFVGEAVSTQTAFQGGGSAISSVGFDPAQSTIGLGAGLRYQVNDAWELSAQYDFDYKADYRSHTGSIRAAYSF